MLKVGDIIKRVQAKCDDPDATYITDDYVLNFVEDVYEWMYNQLKLTGSQFDELVVVLPAVAAGTSTLDAFGEDTKPLASLLEPRIIRYKLPDQDPTYFRRADGPLDYIGDVTNAGLPYLDSWAWQHQSIKLSNFSTPLDIEISGDFLFDPLTEVGSQIQIAKNANRVFSCKLASEVGKARGNDKWVTTYAADADEAMDDLKSILVKANQGKTERLGRMSRSTRGNTRLLNT